MNEYITISGIDSPHAVTTEQARTMRDALLGQIKTVSKIATVDDATRAGEVLTRAKQLTRYIEIARTSAKEKPLQLCRDIDALGHELSDDLDAGAKRLGQLLAAYQAEQNRIAEQMRRDAWEEEQKIKREADRVEREAQEKVRREQAELDRKALVARSAANAEKYRQQAEAKRIQSELDQARRDDEARNRIIETRQTAVMAAPPKQAGIATRRVLKFKVDDVVQLYEAAPYLVKLEANTSALTSALKQLTGQQRLPGVTHWFENESVVR